MSADRVKTPTEVRAERKRLQGRIRLTKGELSAIADALRARRRTAVEQIIAELIVE